MRDTNSSNLNSDLNHSAFGSFMNTPLTPVYPNNNNTAKKAKKQAPKAKEEIVYQIQPDESEQEFSIENNQLENHTDFLRRKVIKMEQKRQADEIKRIKYQRLLRTQSLLEKKEEQTFTYDFEG